MFPRLHIFHVLVFVFFVYGIFTIKYDPKLWIDYGDSWDYLYQSEAPLTSLDFYAPKKIDNYYPRPFIAPLVFKLGMELPKGFILLDPHKKISILFKILHCLVSLLFVLAFLQFLTKEIVKYLAIILIYSLLCSWNIVGWTVLLVSESINCSVFILWLAALLYFTSNFSRSRLVLFLFATFILIFTRDTWSYSLLFFILLLSGIIFIYSKKQFPKFILLLSVVSVFYMLQQYTAQRGERYRLPLYHSILSRIISTQEYTTWFEKAGMPCTQLLQANFPKFDSKNNQERLKVFGTYNDSLYKPLFNWILNDGKGTYTKFLITHPSYFFLLGEKKENVSQIFSQDLSDYIRLPQKKVDYFSTVFPINFIIALLLTLTSVIVFFLRKEFICLLPVTLAFMAFFNALITYNADTMETARHLYITTIIIQIAGVMSLLLSINYLITYLRKNSNSIS